MNYQLVNKTSIQRPLPNELWVSSRPQRPNMARSTVHDSELWGPKYSRKWWPINRFLAFLEQQPASPRFSLPDLHHPAELHPSKVSPPRNEPKRGMAARYLRSGLPLLRTHLAASESAAIAQVPAPQPPFFVVKPDPFFRFRLESRVFYPICACCLRPWCIGAFWGSILCHPFDFLDYFFGGLTSSFWYRVRGASRRRWPSPPESRSR
jgi:hypothetical protein